MSEEQQSNEENAQFGQEEQQIKQMPYFNRPNEIAWIKENLGSDMKPKVAAEKFLVVFPYHNSDEYGDYDRRVEIVQQRFYHWNSDTRRINCQEIKQKKEINKEDVRKVSSYSHPIDRIEYLENFLTCGKELTVAEVRGILSDIGKLVDRLTGDDVQRSLGESIYGGATAEPTKKGYGLVAGVGEIDANS